VEGDFVTMGIGEDFGQVWKIAFKSTTYGKVGIQLPCGIEGVSHMKLVHGLKAHEILLRDQPMTKGSLHLLTITKFCYNIKK
jgi:hypothetical protein